MSAIKKLMKNYAKNVELDELLEKEVGPAGYGGSDMQKTPLGNKITLYVSRPGLVIGRRGAGIRSLTEKVEKLFEPPSPQISVAEVENPMLSPRIVGGKIAQMLSRGGAFRRSAVFALNDIMNAGAMGAEIIVSGKLRSERAHYQKYRAGVVPKSGDVAQRTVREAVTHVTMKMGLYGIRVRIALKDAVPPELEFVEQKQEAKPTEESAKVAEAES